jgi:CheY-like chemotaxis protein
MIANTLKPYKVSIMENARIAIIDDHKSNRTLAKFSLEARGHTVVAEASSRQEAFDLVDQMAKGNVVADVILLDGNLGHTDTYEDAMVIAERLRETGVTSKVLGFSVGSLGEHGIQVDADTFKSPRTAAEIIKEL